LRKHPCAEQNHGYCASGVHTAIISVCGPAFRLFAKDGKFDSRFLTLFGPRNNVSLVFVALFATRRSPPRHAKRVAGAPGLRRKEKSHSASLRHDFAGFARCRSRQLRCSSHAFDTCLRVDAESVLEKNQMWYGGRYASIHQVIQSSRHKLAVMLRLFIPPSLTLNCQSEASCRCRRSASPRDCC
jgi:hypothetical protein